MKKRLVVGVSGASGAPLAVELLRALRANPKVETHLILTRGGEMTLRQEIDMTAEELSALADFTHENMNIGAVPASGSWKSSDNLLLRAADCMLKEHRKLVLVARESPLSTLHLENLCKASQYGAVILPPMQTYYNHPATVQEMTHHTVQRILSQFDLDNELCEWEGMDE